jgi:hypothetical protein
VRATPVRGRERDREGGGRRREEDAAGGERQRRDGVEGEHDDHGAYDGAGAAARAGDEGGDERDAAVMPKVARAGASFTAPPCPRRPP